jgi:hypothetical protein
MAKTWGQKHKIAAKRHSAASRNRIRGCPQITLINADTEKEYFICVHLRILRAKAGKSMGQKHKIAPTSFPRGCADCAPALSTHHSPLAT